MKFDHVSILSRVTALVACGLLLAACGKSETRKTTTTGAGAERDLNKSINAAKDAGKSLGDAAKQAADQVAAQMNSQAESLKPQIDSLRASAQNFKDEQLN